MTRNPGGEGTRRPSGGRPTRRPMMSSGEETEYFAPYGATTESKQQQLQKKQKRTRQRVDAGEPRNNYSSIPHFTSRPSFHAGLYGSIDLRWKRADSSATATVTTVAASPVTVAVATTTTAPATTGWSDRQPRPLRYSYDGSHRSAAFRPRGFRLLRGAGLRARQDVERAAWTTGQTGQ